MAKDNSLEDSGSPKVGQEEAPAQDAILSKILGKPMRDDPLVLGTDEPDMDLPFDHVPAADMEVGSEVYLFILNLN